MNLLRELAGLFLEEYPRWRAELREAIAGGDAATLKRAAHNVKGSMAHFGAHAAFEAAQALEKLGRSGMLGGAEEVCAALEKEVERVQPHLAALVGDDGAGGPAGRA